MQAGLLHQLASGRPALSGSALYLSFSFVILMSSAASKEATVRSLSGHSRALTGQKLVKTTIAVLDPQMTGSELLMRYQSLSNAGAAEARERQIVLDSSNYLPRNSMVFG